MQKKDLLYAEEAYQIIGACFAVYKEKGNCKVSRSSPNVSYLSNTKAVG